MTNAYAYVRPLERDVQAARDAILAGASLKEAARHCGMLAADLDLALWDVIARKGKSVGNLDAPPRMTMAEIAEKVASAYGITIDELRQKFGPRAHAPAQQHAMWLMRRQKHLSLKQIGRYMSDRDHSSVVHANTRHQVRVDAGTVLVSL